MSEVGDAEYWHERFSRCLAMLGETQAQLRASEAECERLRREMERLDGRRREGRQLLARMVKYCREDRATTERATRLERLVAQVADYLNRTHEQRDILRSKDEGVGAVANAVDQRREEEQESKDE